MKISFILKLVATSFAINVQASKCILLYTLFLDEF